MGKYCGYCGAQLDISVKVCGQCGMPVSTAKPVTSDATGFKSPAQGEMRRKKIIKRLVILVLFAAIAITTVKVITQFTGYNGLVRKVMAAYEDYDIDTLVSLSSEMYYYGEKDWAEYYFEYNVGDDLDYFEASVGYNYKMSYEINEIYVMSERNTKDVMESLYDYTYAGFDAGSIEKIAVADLTVTAKQGSKSDDLDIKIIMSNEGWSWKLMYIE